MKKIFFYSLFAFLFNGYCLTAVAWNMMTHQIVAEIAYRQLTPAAKKHALVLVKKMRNNDKYIHRFTQLGSWPDTLKWHNILIFNSWHYIDIPIQMIKFTQARIKEYRLADIYVMDVAEISNGFKIIECNCFNGTGFYQHDIEKIVAAINVFIKKM